MLVIIFYYLSSVIENLSIKIIIHKIGVDPWPIVVETRFSSHDRFPVRSQVTIWSLVQAGHIIDEPVTIIWYLYACRSYQEPSWNPLIYEGEKLNILEFGK